MKAYRSRTRASEPVRALLRVGALLCLSAGLGGCSLTLSSFENEPEEVTGSIVTRPPVTPRFPSDLEPEDLRRAMGALALALNPQGNGQPVKWDNPESRRSGAIVPSGGPFVASDEICRHFTATVARPRGPSTSLAGTACKLSADEWQIRKLSASGA